MNGHRILSAAIPLILLTACTDKQEPTPKTAPASATSAASSASAPTTSTSAAPAATTAGGSHRLGEKVAIANGIAEVTALAYKQPVARDIDTDSPGTEWGAAQVRVCIRRASPDGRKSYISEEPWLLVYADGDQYEPSNLKYDSFPQPEYPVSPDREVPVGRCVKGWITFPVTKGKRPDLVSYSSESASKPIDWAIK